MTWPPPQAEYVRPWYPPICLWNIRCEFATADVNQDGYIDAWDIRDFLYEWNDGIRVDRNGDGCAEADNDDNGVCDECDMIRFMELWELGI